MKKFIALFREPDGRTQPHSEAEISQHQENWKNWFARWGQQGKLNGGSGLTLNGRILKGNGNVVLNEIHKNQTEIIGGFLLLNADDFEEAVTIMQTCPIYEFGGYVEIRELQNQN